MFKKIILERGETGSVDFVISVQIRITSHPMLSDCYDIQRQIASETEGTGRISNPLTTRTMILKEMC